MKSKYKPYPSYRDSGIEWLGEVPIGWDVRRLKTILQERKEKNSPVKTKDILSLCMYRGVIPYSEKGNSGNKAKDDLTAYKLAYPNDIVLNSMNVVAGSVGLSKYFGAVSPVYYMLYPRKSTDDISYFNAIFQSESFQKSLIGLGNGILVKQSEKTGKLNTIRMKISMDSLNDVLMPIPPFQEQQTIANYLDNATAKIDTLIEKQTKLIALLKEKRQAVISTAVTRGLENQHGDWNKYRLDWVSSIVRGNIGFKKDELLDNGEYVALQYGKTYKVDEVNKKFEFYINKEFYKFSQLVHCGDTILISTSETVEDLGHSCFYNRDDLGLIGGEQILLKPDTKLLCDKYLYYSSKVFCSGLKKYASGLKVFRFNTDDLKKIFISIPSLENQQDIANYIDDKTSKIDILIEKSTKSIVLLKERRVALISAAVTGKIDVREIA